MPAVADDLATEILDIEAKAARRLARQKGIDQAAIDRRETP